MDWKPISEAPKDGRPLWARGWDWGTPDTTRHYGWVYWDGNNWKWSGSSEWSFANYLTDFLPAPPKEPTHD